MDYSHEIENIQPGEFITIKKDKPVVTYVAVSSAVAAKWLEHNKHNRAISETGVLRYQSDMEAGRFANTGEPIQFSKSGVLLNGQNRLTALANCVPPITIPMVVVRGLEDRSQFLMDQNIKRTPGQQLGLMGVKNSAQVASAARLYINWQGGSLFTDDKRQRALSLAAVEQWTQENEKLVDQFNRYLAHVTRVCGGTPSVAGAMSIHGLEIDQQATIAFFYLMHARSNLPAGSPILALDSRLRNARMGKRLTQREELAYFIQTWNNWMRGERVSRVQGGRGGWHSDNFPIMETHRGRKFDSTQLQRGLELAGYEA